MRQPCVIVEMNTIVKNPLAEHYICTSVNFPGIGPRVLEMVRIMFEYADDLASALKKWEKMGFVMVGSSDAVGRTATKTFADPCREAAAMGASLVVSTPVELASVFLAPTSIRARNLAESAPGIGWTHFEHAAATSLAGPHIGPMTFKAVRVRTGFTNDLQAMVSKWEAAGFVKLGSADDVGKNDEMGFADRHCYQAVAVGASLVLFQITPAKLRAVRRNANGHIDMEKVRADPPAYLYPRGYSVVQAVYLAPTSSHARDLAESSSEFGSRDLPI